MKCPFKKKTYHLDCYGNQMGAGVGNNQLLAESREEFNECDKEKCMAFSIEEKKCLLCQQMYR